MTKDEYQKKQEKLIARCPKLFSENAKGLECRAGWYQIIEDLSCRLDGLYNKDEAVVVVGQIKEKFGGLRFYLDKGHGLDGVEEAIERSTKLSYETCEFCGESGELRHLRWARTLCDEHHEHEARRFKIIDLEDDARVARREAERIREDMQKGNPAWVGPVFPWEVKEKE